MSDENQFIVPPSFIALFVPPGRIKPTESREFIAERYEWCEDLATMLMDTARQKLWELGITEADVLDRVHQGLREGGIDLDAAQAQWVIHRLAELLEWPWTPVPPGGA